MEEAEHYILKLQGTTSCPADSCHFYTDCPVARGKINFGIVFTSRDRGWRSRINRAADELNFIRDKLAIDANSNCLDRTGRSPHVDTPQAARYGGKITTMELYKCPVETKPNARDVSSRNIEEAGMSTRSRLEIDISEL